MKIEDLQRLLGLSPKPDENLGWRSDFNQDIEHGALENPLFDPISLLAGGLASPVRKASIDIAEQAPRLIAGESGAIFPKNATFAQGKVIPGFNNKPNTPSWFTTDRQVADNYASQYADDIGSNTGFAKLNPKNTLDLSELQPNAHKNWEMLHKKGLVDTPILPDDMMPPQGGDHVFDNLESWDIYKKAKASGYDSVIIPDEDPSGLKHLSYGMLDHSRIDPALPTQKMAHGGLVQPTKEKSPMFNDMFEEEQKPDLGAMLKTAQSTPPTDYSFYKNMTAEDRAKLAQDLMAKQHSGGSLIASGLGGVGDAISNSYGGKNTSFQKDVDEGAQKATDAALSNFDTQRSQHAQDFQGNQMMQEGDPMSPLSQQGRDFFKANGVQVPSGMNFTQLKTLAPSMADLVKGKWEQSFRDAQLAATNNQNSQANQIRLAELERQKDSDAAGIADKNIKRKTDAAETLAKRGITQRIGNWISSDPAVSELEKTAGIGDDSFQGDGWSIKKKGK